MKQNQPITKQLLLSSNYWVLNKDMVQLFGLETAFLLSNFAEAERIMADPSGWFYQTTDTVEEMTTLTRHKQDQCIKQLEDLKILEKDVRGVPPKRYFRINYECLTNQFVNFQQINVRNLDKSICKKSATNKESSYKESSYKESSYKESIKDIVSNGTSSLPKTNKYNIFFETYNEQGVINHQKLTQKMKQAIDRALKNNSQEELLETISRYGEAYNSDYKFAKFKMTLDKFLTQSNGYYDWLDEGQKWINYKDFKNKGATYAGADKQSSKKDTGIDIAKQAGILSF